jgi:AcrR family transcriptional regulator
MSPERRKAMIVAAALPLVAEYGTAVTTSKIAKAAGIGEATIFRVFADKEELLDACMAEVLRPDHVVEQIASIPLDQPLAARLTEAVDAVGAHMERIGAIAGALVAGGHRGRRDPTAPPSAGPGAHGPAGGGSDARAASMAMIRDAIADLLEPEKHALRLPVEQAASIFLGLTFARSPLGGGREAAPDRAGRREDEPGTAAWGGIGTAELVEVFLHGALAGPHERQEET